MAVMDVSEPRFPPLITGYPVDPSERAFDVACARAAAGELGAADLVWSRARDRVELALILEPDVPLSRAREMYPLAATALADSLGALMPPMTTVLLRWPSGILINGAEAGSLRFSASTGKDDEVPDWIAIGLVLALEPPSAAGGEAEGTTAVFAEGGGDLDRNRMLESFSAHMLTWIHVWQDDGFAAVHEQLIGRIEGHEEPARIRTADGSTMTGKVLALTDDMQLLVKSAQDGAVHALPLAAALAERANPL